MNILSYECELAKCHNGLQKANEQLSELQEKYAELLEKGITGAEDFREAVAWYFESFDKWMATDARKDKEPLQVFRHAEQQLREIIGGKDD